MENERKVTVLFRDMSQAALEENDHTRTSSCSGS